MCGLVGFNKFENGELNPEKLKSLLFINALTRGKDSTGIFTPSLGTIKSVFSADTFLIQLLKSNKGIEEELKKDSVFIGHVRQKTHGEKKKENAHPFTYGNVTGAHNGTLNNHLELIKEEDKEDYPVDSMILFSRLNQDKNFNVLSEFDGAAAILFFNDLTPDTIYAYRNDDRPLFRGTIKDSGIFFSSIEDSLKIIGCESVEELKPHYVYTYTKGLFVQTKKIVNKVSFKVLKNFSQESIADFIGFNLFINKSNVDKRYYMHYNEPDNCFLHLKDFSYPKNSSVKSTYAVSCLTISDYLSGKKGNYDSEITLSKFNVNSYNGFFQKGSYVSAIRTLYFTDKGGKQTEKVACSKDELFIITQPLLSKNSREVGIKSLANKNSRNVFVDVKFLKCVINKQQFEELCNFNNIPIEENETVEVIKLAETITPEAAKELELNVLNDYLTVFTRKVLNKYGLEPLDKKDTKFLEDSFLENIDEAIKRDEDIQKSNFEKVYSTLEDVVKVCNSLANLLPAEDYKDLKIADLTSDCDQAISVVSDLYESYTIMEADKI